MTRRDIATQRRQDAAFRAYVRLGTVKGAAHEIGVSQRRLRQLLDGYCESHGYASWVQAVFRFGNSERGAEIGR